MQQSQLYIMPTNHNLDTDLPSMLQQWPTDLWIDLLPLVTSQSGRRIHLVLLETGNLILHKHYKGVLAKRAPPMVILQHNKETVPSSQHTTANLNTSPSSHLHINKQHQGIQRQHPLRKPQIHLLISKPGQWMVSLLHTHFQLPRGPQHQYWDRRFQQKNGLEPAEEGVWGWRSSDPADPHWKSYYHLRRSEDTPLSPWCHIHNNKSQGTLLALLREPISDVRQLLKENWHASSKRYISLVNNCKSIHTETKEIVKIMLLQHTVRYHETHDWI